MAEAKDEAGATPGLYICAPTGLAISEATADQIAAVLLANPEARMAVLEKMPEVRAWHLASQLGVAAVKRLETVTKLIAELESDTRLPDGRHAPCRASEATISRLARLMFDIESPPIPEAGRCCFTSDEIESCGAAAVIDGMCEPHARVVYGSEVARDHTLSAPTAESGKSHRCSKCGSVDRQCEALGCLTAAEQTEPAPVAEAPSFIQDKGPINEASTSEAPERVTQTVGGRDYMEQLEREVERLKEELAGLNAADRVSRVALSGLVEDRDRLRTQLTAANLKAEGLRGDLGEAQREVAVRLDHLEEWQVALEEERDELKAKLAESERKLEAFRSVAESVRGTCFGKHYSSLWQAINDLIGPGPASTEPAGVEAGKADPTETEAPARFRVGQRVRWIPSGRVFRIEPDQLEVVMSNPHNYELVRAKKPADPAPPKPGGEALTRAELVDALRNVQALDCLPAAAISTVRLVADGLEAGSNV